MAAEDYIDFDYDPFDDSDQGVTCMYCCEPELEWVRSTEFGRWYLYDQFGNRHRCSQPHTKVEDLFDDLGETDV